MVVHYRRRLLCFSDTYWNTVFLKFAVSS